MVEDPPVDIFDRASVSVARERVRSVATAAGFSHADIERLALAVSELAQNQLDHARDGQITARRVDRGGVAGVEIEATDRGDGIPNLGGILDGSVRGQGLGAGLLSVRRIATELDADVRANEGTTVRARLFVGPTPRHPEVAIRGRGLEARSGDHAVVRREGDVLLVAVLDGAGHGPLAREAAEEAATYVRFDAAPSDILLATHEALRRTRGASASVLRFDLSRQTLTVAGVGNVTVRVVSGDTVTSFRPRPGLLGSRRIDPNQDVIPFPTRSVAYAFTDGVSSRVDVRDVAARSATSIADLAFGQHAKGHDDALLAVVR